MMKPALALLALTLAVPASAQLAAPDFDLADFAAARGRERVHCAQNVKRSIEEERARCGSGPGCNELREADRVIADNIIFTSGGLPEGQETDALRLLAASGCPSLIILSEGVGERTRLCPEGQDCDEIFSVESAGPRPRPDDGQSSGERLINDWQARVEGVLGIDINEHTRFGVSAITTRRWRVRNGVLSWSERESAFIGFTYKRDF